MHRPDRHVVYHASGIFSAVYCFEVEPAGFYEGRVIMHFEGRQLTAKATMRGKERAVAAAMAKVSEAALGIFVPEFPD